jgi:hypothetical protein
MLSSSLPNRISMAIHNTAREPLLRLYLLFLPPFTPSPAAPALNSLDDDDGLLSKKTKTHAHVGSRGMVQRNNPLSLASAKDKGLFKSHIEEKSVSVYLAALIHER